MSLEEFWEEWAEGPDRSISPDLVLAGRGEQKKQVKDWAQGARRNSLSKERLRMRQLHSCMRALPLTMWTGAALFFRAAWS